MTLPGFFGVMENQAEANGDENGKGTVADEVGTQEPVYTNDPSTSRVNDPTVLMRPEAPAAGLFQARPESTVDVDDVNTDDREAQVQVLPAGIRTCYPMLWGVGSWRHTMG